MTFRPRKVRRFGTLPAPRAIVTKGGRVRLPFITSNIQPEVHMYGYLGADCLTLVRTRDTWELRGCLGGRYQVHGGGPTMEAALLKAGFLFTY